MEFRTLFSCVLCVDIVCAVTCVAACFVLPFAFDHGLNSLKCTFLVFYYVCIFFIFSNDITICVSAYLTVYFLMQWLGVVCIIVHAFFCAF